MWIVVACEEVSLIVPSAFGVRGGDATLSGKAVRLLIPFSTAEEVGVPLLFVAEPADAAVLLLGVISTLFFSFSLTGVRPLAEEEHAALLMLCWLSDRPRLGAARLPSAVRVLFDAGLSVREMVCRSFLLLVCC